MIDDCTPLEPVTPAAIHLREQVSDRRWAAITRKAQIQAAIVRSVRQKSESAGLTPYEALRQVSPDVPWPTYQFWSRRVDEEQSGSWESLVDRRLPPKKLEITDAVRASAVTIRRLCPNIKPDEALELLVNQHRERGSISRTSLYRIWEDAGLLEAQDTNVEEVVVEEYHGGAGLALVAAAEAELGATLSLANAALSEAQQVVDAQQDKGLSFPAEPSGRDERGHFTAEYNHSTRAGVEKGKRDARWKPDFAKRAERDLSRLQVLEHSPRIVRQKFMAIGVMAMVTERRGFDGLDGPCGEWLAVCCGHPYMSSTLDKFLGQLGLLDVEDALWEAHATVSRDLIVRWASVDDTVAWLKVAIYIDSTQEPHWTREYAKSGKISRTGEVGPCLTRVTITGGPGVPLLIETFAGTVSLKTELPRLLARVESCIGKGELGRFTIIDAEMATAKILHALQSDKTRSFITVLKGSSVPKNFVPKTDWQVFRERDQVRDGEVVLRGKGAPKEGVTVRAVEMRRPGRHPHSTFFGAAGSDTANMSPQELAEAYLTRWPHQESVFRDTRNGMGMERTHGYSGEMVHHLAIEKKADKAERHLLNAQRQLVQAQEAHEVSERLEKKARKADAGKAAELCRQAKSQADAAKKKVESAKKDLDAVNTTPRVIYERDTARENVVTAAKMTVLLLIEYVLREYFSGLGIEYRTFIEYFVNLPVRVCTSNTEVCYQIEESPRNRVRTEQLRQACAEITRRQIILEGRRMVFEVVEPQRRRVELRRT